MMFVQIIPENIVCDRELVQCHPGWESDEPELGGDHGAELSAGGVDEERRGHRHILPHTPGPSPGHGAHQLQH